MAYAITRRAGVYADPNTGHFFERPTIAGKRTWRRLFSMDLASAEREMWARRTQQAQSKHGLDKDPYAPPSATVGELAAEWETRGCPKTDGHRREGPQLQAHKLALRRVLPFWKDIVADQITSKDIDKFRDWRTRELHSSARDGLSTVDMELTILSGMFMWSMDGERLKVNPLAGRKKFANPKDMIHCRERAPRDADELHALARRFFQTRSESGGWAILLQAMTGCRANEVLALSWDAQGEDAGAIKDEADSRILCLKRSKNGVNPFALIHPALAECLRELRRWRDWRYPQSPWFIPSPRDPMLPLNEDVVPHGLAAIAEGICGQGQHRTTHGLRSYYVTVRRSQGIPDGQIAVEIGDASGAAIIVRVYGDLPPGWRGAKNPLTWLPKHGEPAWAALDMPANVVPMASAG